MAQHTIDLPCVADTYCSAENPDTNYGSATVLNAGGYSGILVPDTNIRFFALAKFNNWSSLPARKNVTSILLRVYSAKEVVTISAGSYVSYNALNAPFVEGSATFNTVGDRSYGGGGYRALEDQTIPANQWVELEILPAYNQYQDNLIDNGLYFLWWKWGSGGPPSDEYWQVHSRENTNPMMLRITYEDAPPDAPTLLEPIGGYIDNASVIRFAWEYNSSVGGTQKAFDLQWSTDGSTWTTISQTSANNYYDMSVCTIPSGNIYWRVRTYNEYDEASPYSEAETFFAIGAPAAPVIQSVSTNTARPVVTWTSTGQQVWQVHIVQGENILYDSGWMGTAVTSHKITTFLPEGTYIAQVRIKNEYDLASEWGENEFNVSTTKPGTPVLAISNINYGLDLALSNIDAADYALIYRSISDEDDYVCIGKVEPADPAYNDYAGVTGQEYDYFVRSVSEDETYADSTVHAGIATFKNSEIHSVSDPSNLVELKFNINARPRRNHYINQVESAVYYSGRKYPVVEPSEHTDSTMNLGFYFKTYPELEAFINLYELKETVLYRDNRGRKIYGSLNNLSIKDEIFGFSIRFSITQTDYIEELEV